MGTGEAQREVEKAPGPAGCRADLQWVGAGVGGDHAARVWPDEHPWVQEPLGWLLGHSQRSDM